MSDYGADQSGADQSGADQSGGGEPQSANSNRQQQVPWLWVTIVIIVLDQISKALADYYLHLYDAIPLLSSGESSPALGLNLTLAYNKGAAFSFLADAGGWQRWMFSLLAVVISLVLFRWLRSLKAGQPFTAAALASILGGAVGNLIDRAILGHVVDFIDTWVRLDGAEWHWPAFNVADSAITIGVILLIIAILRGESEHRASDSSPEAEQ